MTVPKMKQFTLIVHLFTGMQAVLHVRTIHP